MVAVEPLLAAVISASTLGVGVVSGISKMMVKFGGKGDCLQNITEIEHFA